MYKDEKKSNKDKNKKENAFTLDHNKMFSLISYKKSSLNDKKTKVVKDSESSTSKDDPNKVGQIQIGDGITDVNDDNVIEFGRDKKKSDNLILGFKTRAYSRNSKTVYRNKSRKKIINADVALKSEKPDLATAEAMETDSEQSPFELMRNIRYSTHANDGKTTKLDEVLPFVNSEEEKRQIENLEKIKSKTLDNQLTQDLIDKKSKQLIENKKVAFYFYEKLRLALLDAKKFKNNDDLYSVYLTKKWLQTVLENGDSESSGDGVPQDVKEFIIEMYANLMSLEEIKRNTFETMKLNVSEEDIKKVIVDYLKYLEIENDKLVKTIAREDNCFSILINKINDQQNEDVNIYVVVGCFLDREENRMWCNFLGVWTCSNGEEILSQWTNIASSLLEKGIRHVEVLVSDQQTLDQIKNVQGEIVFERFAVDLYDICNDLINEIIIKTQKLEKDIEFYNSNEGSHDNIKDKNELLSNWKGTFIDNIFGVEYLTNDCFDQDTKITEKAVKAFSDDIINICGKENFDKTTANELNSRWSGISSVEQFIIALDNIKNTCESFNNGQSYKDLNQILSIYDMYVLKNILITDLNTELEQELLTKIKALIFKIINKLNLENEIES